GDGALDLTSISNIDRMYFYSDCRCRVLDRSEKTNPHCRNRISNDRCSVRPRRDFFQKLQKFAAKAVFERGETRSIATRPRHAIDQASTDRVSDQHEHDRYAIRCLQQRSQWGSPICQNDIRRKCDQFRRVFPSVRRITAAPSIVDLQIAAVGPAEFLQCLPEHCDAGLRCRIIGSTAVQYADAADTISLLSKSSEWKRNRAPKEADEFAPLHYRS